MKDFKGFHRAGVLTSFRERSESSGPRILADEMRPAIKNVRGGHRPQIRHQSVQRLVGNRDTVDVDYGMHEAGIGKQRRECRSLDPGMHVRGCDTRRRVRGAHGVPELGQSIAARRGAEEEAIFLQPMPDQAKRKGKVVDAIQRTDREHQVVPARFGFPCIFDQDAPVGSLGEERPGVGRIHAFGKRDQPLRPARIGASDDQSAAELPGHHPKPLEAIFKRAFVKEQLRAQPGRPVPPPGPQFHVEQVRHGGACALGAPGRQEAMVISIFRAAARWALDFALPPRCAGCGTIVGDVHSFCPDCWIKVQFLGESGCATCGLPLAGTEQTACGRCQAKPPRILRTRAAVSYDELSRDLAIRLKYGRKVAIARTMARYMAPLVSFEGEPVLVPVPLHRGRLWSRGFNQSALVARELSRRLGIPSDPLVLRRTRATPALKGMSHLQRRKAVAGAFDVRDRNSVAGKTIILVDDVLTTGSTADACARTLKRAGAARVELVTWARVVKPSQLMR